MNTTKVILAILSLLCVLLGGHSAKVVSQSNDKSPEKGVTQSRNIKDLLEEVTQIAVFRWADKGRKYVGSLKKDESAFQSALNELRESQTIETSDMSKPEYEVALMGEGFLRRARCDTRAGVMTFYSPEKAAKPDTTVRLNHSLADLLTSAKLPDQPTENFKPQHFSQASWLGLPDNLVRAVSQSPVILIGKPVDLFRVNYFDPSDTKIPVQYTVYMIEVERYLKDDTGQFMPFIKYWDYGGVLKGGYEMKLLPLLKYNQRYLLFLLPGGNRGMALWNGKQIRLWYPDEFTHANPFLQTPIVNGATVQRYPTPGFVANIYFFGDKTTLVGKPEGQVISEIIAAIEQAKQERC